MLKTKTTVSSARQVHLRVLSTTDVHGNLMGFDYFSDGPVQDRGLTRVASLIAHHRNEADNVLLFDNGDFLQGTPLADGPSAARPAGLPHPVVASLNHLRYDAVGLGNHEFNFGLKHLSESLLDGDFPALCANMHATTEDANALWAATCAPWTILKRNLKDQTGELTPFKIGLFGVLPPQTTIWDQSRLRGTMKSLDIVPAAQDCIAALKDAGADLIIALAHTGIIDRVAHDRPENAGLLLSQVTGIDALILGHSHHVLPVDGSDIVAVMDSQKGLLNGVPFVQAGHSGTHLGVTDLWIDVDTRKVARSQSRAEPVLAPDGTSAKEESSLVRALAPYHEMALEQVRRPVGVLKHPLDTFFALATETLAIRATALAQANFVADALKDGPLQGLPVLSATAPFKCGGRFGVDHYSHVPAGPFAPRHIADLQPYPNDIAALQLSGSAILDWLEMAASLYHQVPIGAQDAPLRDLTFPSYNCDTVFGLSYEINLAKPSRFGASGLLVNPNASRVENVRFQGQPIDTSAQFILAVNNYRAGGGGHYPHTGPERVVFQRDIPIRQLLQDHLAHHAPFDAEFVPSWRFSTLPNTSVRFETHPDAAHQLGTVPWLDLGIAPPHANSRKKNELLKLRLSLG